MNIINFVAGAVIGIIVGLCGSVFYLAYQKKKLMKSLDLSNVMDMIQGNNEEMKIINQKREDKVKQVDIENGFSKSDTDKRFY